MRKLILLAAAVVLAGMYTVVDWTNRPGNYDEPKEVLILRGENSQSVALKLQESGIIEKPWLFRVIGRFNGLDKKLKAGEYRFEPQMSLLQVMEKIAAGDIFYRKVTLPEGLTTSPVRIFTPEGRLLDSFRSTPGLNRRQLPTGIYIVQVGVTVRKVAVKVK